MDKPFLDKLRKIDPYVPGEQPKTASIIKLNANENPYPPAPGVAEVLRTFDTAKLAVYPDANAKALKTAVAERFGLRPAQVFLGNGSDDVLALAFQSFFCSGEPILYPDITYSFYPVWCDLFRIPYETMPLDEDFCVNVRDYDKPNGGIVLPNPNAPTGRGVSLDFLEDLLQHNQDCVVIIDEAYVDFGAQSAVPLLDKYENLLIVQTTSKSRSLAGMRIGYALGSETLISTLEAVKNSYNSYTMDAVALAVGEASIRDEAYFQDTCRKVAATRDRSADELRALGFTVLPSLTNFLFVTHPEKKAPDIFAALREKGIFIRYFKLPRIDNYLRITVGTDEQMDKLLAALKEIL
ncbi:histidinol-phosphate transaminase [uncultured Agathobaculum sp.]|uniref:histidinol-phosphate transaminase n=1 Tax=uncultured Agathobaculum sp. TaxID=2048140 RepID=UPI00296E8E84